MHTHSDHPLAWRDSGERIDLPDEADCWLVKRARRYGPPEIIYADDGLPLRLPLYATIEDVAAAVGEAPARYRLDVLDAHGKLIRGVSALVEIKEAVVPDAAAPGEIKAAAAAAPTGVTLHQVAAAVGVFLVLVLHELRASRATAPEQPGVPAAAPSGHGSNGVSHGAPSRGI